MTKTHQLEATLRSLALSGMLETIEARLAQRNRTLLAIQRHFRLFVLK